MSDMAIFRQSETEQNRIAENGRRLDTADEAAIGARNGTSTISRQRSLLLGDHEIRQCPVILIRLDLDLLRLLVHLQFACRQRRPLGAFSVGRKK